MIHAVLIFNNAGKPRLTKFYSPSSPATRAHILERIVALVHPRDDTLCNFVDLAPDFGFADLAAAPPDGDGRPDEARVIYRHYATLYFAFVVDQSESELGILDLIQVLVESLDKCFENVCELDLIFHFDQVHTLLNCIITGGLVLDTSLDSIQANFKLQHAAKKQSESAGGIGLVTGAGGGLSAITSGRLGGGSGSASPSIGSSGGGGLFTSGGAAEGAWERISSSLGSFRR
ncbi:hypothetical protein JCM11491_003054 [Sporobolomyces phaffii]